MEKYIEIRDIASYLQCVQLAFPVPDKANQYFAQCPSSLNNFTRRFHSEPGSKLFTAARNFQRNIVIKWNENANEVTLTIFLDLIGIDESASNECGAITLDILLWAGVLEEGKKGEWTLAPNYQSMRVHLFGDGKQLRIVCINL